MRRKHIEGHSITQSNDARCHNQRSNGHKNRASLKRHASKRARQLLVKDTESEIDTDLPAEE